ncbi:MAG: hypothetical protein ACO3J6_07620 [Opitutales bacterium]
MTTYKVSTIGFFPEFDLLYKQLFGEAVHVASKVEGNVAFYAFDEPQQFTDLAPMVKVEVVPNNTPEFYS